MYMAPGRNMGINTDSGHGRIMDPDIVFSRIPGQNVTMVPGGCTGHSDWYGL